MYNSEMLYHEMSSVCQYPGVDGGFPHASLEALKDGHDDLQLGRGQDGLLLLLLPRVGGELGLGVHEMLVVWRTGRHWGTLPGDLSSGGVLQVRTACSVTTMGPTGYLPIII